MQVKSIKVSNILSFRHVDNIDNAEEIILNSPLNILIGPNGVGKSNFLEILNYLFKHILFKHCKINIKNISNYKNNPNGHNLKNTLTSNNANVCLLEPHNKSGKKDKKILITITLNNNDVNNLKFILKNKDLINEILKTYSNTNLEFDPDNKVNISDLNKIKNKEIIFLFEDLNDSKNFNHQRNTDACINFVQSYLEYYEYLRDAIYLANTEKKQKFSSLKNPFAMISCYRDYNSISPEYPANTDETAKHLEHRQEDKNSNTKAPSNSEPVAFLYVKNKLSYFGKKQFRNKGMGLPDIEEKIKENPVYIKINNYLKEFLGTELKVSITDENSWKFDFSFLKGKHKLNISDLSSGEKAIIHFIFSVYGYDLKDGLMIIDEPELHLHTQVQKKYIKIMKNVIKEFNLQFIIVTHSPVFVEPQTINNIHRFYKENDKTKVAYNPSITSKEKDLIHILSYTNSAKVFFANKVILVEGPMDEYFYKNYLDLYLETKKQTELDSVEVLDINGKGSSTMWIDFLKAFKIDVYCIFYWVAVKKLDKIDDNFKNKIKRKLTTRKQNGKTIPDIIRELRSEDAVKTKQITTFIKERYLEKEYILEKGELEDYLQITKKDFGEVIKFCKHRLNKWFGEKKHMQYEIKRIFNSIIEN